jgi:hypothetical protein
MTSITASPDLNESIDDIGICTGTHRLGRA